MRQSNVIFGTLLFMFVVYITMRGQLPAYLDLFRKKQAGESSKGGGGGSKNILEKAGNAIADGATKMLGDAAKAYITGQ